jgi:hypothetical protein
MKAINLTRRTALQTMLGAACGSALAQAVETAGDGLRVATFRFDVTPPVGHPLCGGWIKPVAAVEDELEALGYVVLGAGAPIVVCVMDWTGLLNAAHLEWRQALATAAGTTPERVAVQCVHQHDAPFVCLRTQELLDEFKTGLINVDRGFFAECLKRGADAVQRAMASPVRLTHVAFGEGKVEKVAGNRRVLLDAEGRVKKMRGSSCRDPELIALPEGLIDPMLKTVAFYSGDKKVLASHYYACHPMSHYGKGQVSSDYVGLARKRRQQAEPGCLHLYFSGAGGNIGAGKYNDGTPEARVALTERIHAAMVLAEAQLKPQPITRLVWQSKEILPQVNPVFTVESEQAHLKNEANGASNRIRPAMRLAWMERVAAKVPIVLSALHANEVTLLHLPAESFVEYQLRAQQMAPQRFVATAAYGDGGTWYVPTEEAFPQGGYEVTVANSAASMDPLMSEGIRTLIEQA